MAQTVVPDSLLAVLVVLVLLWRPSVTTVPPPADPAWQQQLQFWQITSVAWSPPASAVYVHHPTSSLCHCRHLCLADHSCVAGELVQTDGVHSCRLASQRGDGSSAVANGGAFVRNGRATLGEACLTSEECRLGMPGTDCDGGVCVCPVSQLTDPSECTIVDCSELVRQNSSSGQYWLRVTPGEPPVAVFCDMEADGGGWTVFQRRQDDEEQVDFYRDWQSYRDGFGNVSGQFWLGNELIHRLTARRSHELRVDLEDFEGEKRFAQYGVFSVADEADKYRLRVGSYSGNAGDAQRRHDNMRFSTKDQDNDIWANHCSQNFKGGWWYSDCHNSNLNGLYLRGAMPEEREDGLRTEVGVSWRQWKGYRYSLKISEMKIRPLDFSQP